MLPKVSTCNGTAEVFRCSFRWTYFPETTEVFSIVLLCSPCFLCFILLLGINSVTLHVFYFPTWEALVLKIIKTSRNKRYNSLTLVSKTLEQCPFQQDCLLQIIMSSNLLKTIVKIFPTLNGQNIKGQCGRIGVVGGSYEFTGAPYYSAISALKVGGDLGHIFCNKASATAIKTYSPQIIVHPIFVSDEEACLLEEGRKHVPQIWMDKIMAWNRAINIWIVGPGLGRDPNIADFFPTLVKNLPEEDIVVFNADGIYHLCKHPQLLQELPRFKRSVLLTNERQWDTLKYQLKLSHISKDVNSLQTTEEITQITSFVSNPEFTVIVKGRKDLILGRKSFICDLQGGRKRCGGIGDIFAGVTGVCTFWDQDLGPILASKITKQATKAAFDKYGRSLTALSIISQLPRTVMEIENRYK